MKNQAKVRAARARSEALSPQRRRDIAIKAAKTRWGSTAKQKPSPRPKRAPVVMAEVAARELWLSASQWTQSDRDRLSRIERGLRWLDDDQATVRGRVSQLLVEYERTQDLGVLMSGLVQMVKVSPARLAVIESREASAAKQQEVEALIRRLSTGPRDMRSPIDRLVDQATGRDKR